jgi:hypothetical protein
VAVDGDPLAARWSVLAGEFGGDDVVEFPPEQLGVGDHQVGKVVDAGSAGDHWFHLPAFGVATMRQRRCGQASICCWVAASTV